MSGFKQSSAYPWALTGIFSAVHLVITLIPYNVSVGGGEISFGLVSSPIIGFLLGPFYGVISVLLGSTLALFINPAIAVLGPFTLLATAAGAFVTGAMRTKDKVIIPILFIISFGIYLVSPIGLALPSFIWFHLIVFAISVLFVIPKLHNTLVRPLNLESDIVIWKRFGSIWLFSLIAVTLDQLVGSAIGGWYFILLGSEFGLILGYYQLVIIVYAIERIIGSIFVALIIFALIEILSKVDYGLPLSEGSEGGLWELKDEEV